MCLASDGWVAYSNLFLCEKATLKEAWLFVDSVFPVRLGTLEFVLSFDLGIQTQNLLLRFIASAIILASSAKRPYLEGYPVFLAP
jgi:hypothetical protein